MGKLGIPVSFISALGTDDLALQMLALLKSEHLRPSPPVWPPSTARPLQLEFLPGTLQAVLHTCWQGRHHETPACF